MKSTLMALLALAAISVFANTEEQTIKEVKAIFKLEFNRNSPSAGRLAYAIQRVGTLKKLITFEDDKAYLSLEGKNVEMKVLRNSYHHQKDGSPSEYYILMELNKDNLNLLLNEFASNVDSSWQDKLKKCDAKATEYLGFHMFKYPLSVTLEGNVEDNNLLTPDIVDCGLDYLGNSEFFRLNVVFKNPQI